MQVAVGSKTSDKPFIDPRDSQSCGASVWVEACVIAFSPRSMDYSVIFIAHRVLWSVNVSQMLKA